MTLDSAEPWIVKSLSPVLLDRETFRDLLPKDGYEPDTVFTTGYVVDGERTDFYQGVDDEWIALASFHTEDTDRFAGAD